MIPLLVLLACTGLVGCTRPPSSGRGGRVERAATTPAPDTLPMPVLAPGMSVAECERALGSEAQRAPAYGDAGAEFWQWTRRDGVDAMATFRGGTLIAVTTRRMRGGLKPAVEARALPEMGDVRTRGELFSAIGRGLLAERSWSALPEAPAREVETYFWQIHDRDRDTGYELQAVLEGERVLHVSHPWSER